MAIFGKTIGHKELKFGTGSFLTRIYNFVFIKIFVGGRLDNTTKMLTNITRKEERHEAVLDLLGYAAGKKTKNSSIPQKMAKFFSFAGNYGGTVLHTKVHQGGVVIAIFTFKEVVPPPFPHHAHFSEIPGPSEVVRFLGSRLPFSGQTLFASMSTRCNFCSVEGGFDAILKIETFQEDLSTLSRMLRLGLKALICFLAINVDN